MSFESVPTDEAAVFRDSIKHVVVLALENRSFDAVLGFLHSRDSEATPKLSVRYPAGLDAAALQAKYPPFFGLDFPRSYNEDATPNPPVNPTPTPIVEGFKCSEFYSNTDANGKSWSASMPVNVGDEVR
jgi:phospholipase C